MAEGGNIFGKIKDKIIGKKKQPKRDDLRMFKIGGSDTSSNSSTNPIKKMRGATWGRQQEMARISAQEHQPTATPFNRVNQVFGNRGYQGVTDSPRITPPSNSPRTSDTSPKTLATQATPFGRSNSSVAINPRNNVPMSSFRRRAEQEARASVNTEGSSLRGSWSTDSEGYNIDRRGTDTTQFFAGTNFPRPSSREGTYTRTPATVASGNYSLARDPSQVSVDLMDFSPRNTPMMERRNPARASDLMGQDTPRSTRRGATGDYSLGGDVESIYSPVGARNLTSPYASGSLTRASTPQPPPLPPANNRGTFRGSRTSTYAPVPTQTPAPRGFIQEPTVMRSKRGKPRHIYKPTLSDVGAGSGTSANPLQPIGGARPDSGNGGYLRAADLTAPAPAAKKKGFFQNLWAKRPFQGAGAKASKARGNAVELKSVRRTIPPPDFGARRYRDSAPPGSAPGTPVSSTARTPPPGFDVGSRVSSTVRRPPVGFGGSETGFKVPMGRSNSMINLGATNNPTPWAGLTPSSGQGAAAFNRRASLPPGSVVGSDAVPNSAAALARRRRASTLSSSTIAKKHKGGSSMWKGIAGGMMLSSATQLITKPLTAMYMGKNQNKSSINNTHQGDGDDPGYSSYDVNFNPAAAPGAVSTQNFQAKPV